LNSSESSIIHHNKILEEPMKAVLLFLASVLTVLGAHAQWTTTTLPTGGTTITSFAESSTSLFVGSGLSVFRSTDNGASWSATGGVAAPGIRALMGVGSVAFCATLVDASAGGVFRSTDDGTNWLQVYNPPGGFDAPAVLALAASTNNATLFAGAAVGPAGTIVARSTDNGANWTTAATGLPQFSAINALQSSAGNIFAAVGVNRGIYKSTNDGTNWALASSGVLGTPKRLNASGTDVYAISDSGMFFTTDGGTSWTAINTTGLGTVSALAISGQNLFAGSTTGGVFLSTNGGSLWTAINTGLTELSVQTLGIVGGTYLLAGTATLVWRRPLSEVVTGMEEVYNETPKEFSLSQNYPNPFNPSTTLGYRVAGLGLSWVRLAVYDIIGREMVVLVNERKAPGSYSVRFDARGLASGVYLYRLQAGNFVEVKKLTMLK
jgi:photosystem II stability/assembly factor-like uncharacterized protein